MKIIINNIGVIFEGQYFFFISMPVLRLYVLPEAENRVRLLANIGQLHIRERHGTMVRAWRSADVAACRAVSNPAWCRIFREISCFTPLNLGTLVRWCVLGQDTSPSNASLDSGENEYLEGQR